MAHKHAVYDTDLHFLINPKTRTITKDNTDKTVILQYDHNSERCTFELQRNVDGHDASLCNRVRVHYINTDGSNITNGVYTVDDLAISPDDDNVVIFSWLISGNATQYVGALSFVVCLECTTGDVVDYRWQTTAYNNVSVSNGIFNTEFSEGIFASATLVEALSNDGMTYAATVDGVTELYNGQTLTIIPEITSTSTNVALNVNGIGLKNIMIPLNTSTGEMAQPDSAAFFVAGHPVTLQYDAMYKSGVWKTVEKQKVVFDDFDGLVPIKSGGTDANNAADARRNLGAAAENHTHSSFPSPVAFNSRVTDKAGVEMVGAEMKISTYTGNTATVANSEQLDIVLFTADSAGLYAVSYSASWAGNEKGIRRLLLRDPLGTNLADARMYPSGTGDISQHLSCYLRLNAGESVTMRAYQNSGGALNIINQTYQVVKIGA